MGKGKTLLSLQTQWQTFYLFRNGIVIALEKHLDTFFVSTFLQETVVIMCKIPRVFDTEA